MFRLKQKLGYKQITVTVGLGRWSGPLYELRQVDPTEPALVKVQVKRANIVVAGYEPPHDALPP